MTPAVLVFVVEDEPLIQDLLREALEEAGFEVVTASSGEEAISILEAADANYRALVTDINLARRRSRGGMSHGAPANSVGICRSST